MYIQHITKLHSLESIFIERGLDNRASLNSKEIIVKSWVYYKYTIKDPRIERTVSKSAQFPGTYARFVNQRDLLEHTIFESDNIEIVISLSVLK